MRQYKPLSSKAQLKAQQAFRFPFVCFACRKSFKFPTITTPRLCPQCRSPMAMLSRKFSAPRSGDIPQWKKVQFLVENGFRFYPVYERVEPGGLRVVPYPATLKEAKNFVETFKAQADKDGAFPPRDHAG